MSKHNYLEYVCTCQCVLNITTVLSKTAKYGIHVSSGLLSCKPYILVYICHGYGTLCSIPRTRHLIMKRTIFSKQQMAHHREIFISIIQTSSNIIKLLAVEYSGVGWCLLILASDFVYMQWNRNENRTGGFAYRQSRIYIIYMLD